MTKKISLKKINSLVLKTRDQKDDFEIQPQINLFDNGYMDSFSVMQLVQSFEDELDVVFDYDDLRRENFSTLEGIFNLLIQKYGFEEAH